MELYQIVFKGFTTGSFQRPAGVFEKQFNFNTEAASHRTHKLERKFDTIVLKKLIALELLTDKLLLLF